jgi:hypothetical protein
VTEIVHIPFHGGEVVAVMNGNKPAVVLKPAIEHIGVDYWTQVEKLRSRSWATTSQSPVVAEDGKVRDMVTVDLRTFLMLLATIDERRVNEAVRPTLIAYQNEVADVIEAWFTRGRTFGRSGVDMGLTTRPPWSTRSTARTSLSRSSPASFERRGFSGRPAASRTSRSAGSSTSPARHGRSAHGRCPT